MDIGGQLTLYTKAIALPFNLSLRTWVVMRMLKVLGPSSQNVIVFTHLCVTLELIDAGPGMFYIETGSPNSFFTDISREGRKLGAAKFICSTL